MKSFVLSVFGALFLLTNSAYAALPSCAVNCDTRFQVCIHQCAQGRDGYSCRSVCSNQHEGCLNACNQSTSLVPSAEQLDFSGLRVVDTKGYSRLLDGSSRENHIQ